MRSFSALHIKASRRVYL